MRLTPMRYKDYIWPSNPGSYRISFRRVVAEHKLPFGRSVTQDLGQVCRVLEGEGEFAGEGAYSQFGLLANTFYDPGPGLLIHPLWQTASAYFVELRLEQEPRPDYVRYSFTFWEDDSWYTGLATRTAEQAQGGTAGSAAAASGSAQAAYHRVVKGDTLWALAGTYGLSLEELIALNPQIKNPNLIVVGEEVRVR